MQNKINSHSKQINILGKMWEYLKYINEQSIVNMCIKKDFWRPRL